MKIAVPTDDGFIIGSQIRYFRGYFVATVMACKIVEEELRWNLLSEILTSEHGFYYNLADCDAVILNKGNTGLGALLAAKGKEIIYTEETLISQAVTNYLKTTLVLTD